MTDTSSTSLPTRRGRLAQALATDRRPAGPITLSTSPSHRRTMPGAGAALTAATTAVHSDDLNGGRSRALRIGLARRVSSHMTSDHLGNMDRRTRVLARARLRFRSRLRGSSREGDWRASFGSAGEYNWGGAGGTGFWVDPKEQLIGVLMAQAQPGPRQREFRELFPPARLSGHHRLRSRGRR